MSMGTRDDEDETESLPQVSPPASSRQGAGAPSQRDGGRRWLPWALVGGIAVVAVVVILIFTVFSSSSDDAANTYQGRVDSILRPVVRANTSLSRTLAGLHGTSSAAAQRSVAAAQAATLTARGGLNALTVPSGSEQLATNARGTLTREASYLSTVKEALSNPGNGSAAQTQTLAGNLTGALDVVAPASEDWSGSVTGADTLTSWATHTAAVIERKRRAGRLRAQQTSQSSGQSTTTAPATPSGGSACGDNVYAGPNTSCPFALNTRRAYDEAPGVTATVEVYSPVTGGTYSMSCSPAGGGVTCSGANNASVTWTY
jgi:hypothetical protein